MKKTHTVLGLSAFELSLWLRHPANKKKATPIKRDVLIGKIIIQFVYIMRNCSAVDK